MFGIEKPTGEIMCHAISDADSTRFHSFVAWKQLHESVGFTHTGRAYSPFIAEHQLLAEVRMRKLNIIYKGALKVREFTEEEIYDITILKLKNVRDQTT